MARPLKKMRAAKISADTRNKFPPLPQAGELRTLDDLQNEWGRIHRGLARGQMAPEIARGLLYSVQVGTQICAAREQHAVDAELLQAYRSLDANGARLIGSGSATIEALPATVPAESEVVTRDE